MLPKYLTLLSTPIPGLFRCYEIELHEVCVSLLNKQTINLLLHIYELHLYFYDKFLSKHQRGAYKGEYLSLCPPR